VRIIRTLDGSGSREEALNQRDGLVRLAHECVNQGKVGCTHGTMKCVLAFRLEFDSSTTFAKGVLLPLHVGVE
jgi:hypothetical protein